MKYFVITLKDNEASHLAAKKCVSSWYEYVDTPPIETHWGCTEDEVDSQMKSLNLKWNYPWQGEVLDLRSGLTKSAYVTKVKNRRIACAISHYTLWKQCVTLNESCIIMEHDCQWIRPFNVDLVVKSKYNIVGLNDPINATRRAMIFNGIVQKNKNKSIIDVPIVDDIKVPQGLAGNSCYYINPKGARELLEAVRYYGLWPNDAIMCRQLIPNMGVTTTYFTQVQEIESTTTL